jgi:hypothetical protein
MRVGNKKSKKDKKNKKAALFPHFPEIELNEAVSRLPTMRVILPSPLNPCEINAQK